MSLEEIKKKLAEAYAKGDKYEEAKWRELLEKEQKKRGW